MKVACKDCRRDGVTTARPAPHPGPRCSSHHRQWRQRARDKSHNRRLWSVFELTAEQYAALYEAQGGVCAICRIATGKARRLAVDHDHVTGEIRGLLCGPDNLMIGRLRVEGMLRAIEYLYDPPARRVLKRL